MPAGTVLTSGLARYHRRFGGEATIVTLADGRAFTAAHCLAAVDGRRGTVVASMDGRQWHVWHRWSPRGCDLALLHAVAARPAHRAVERRGWRLARPGVLRPGSIVEFYGFTERRFELRRATVMAVTATRAVANVRSPAGVAAGDSGGPAFVNGRLAGIVIARTGPAVSPVASTQVVLARLDRGRRLPLRS